MAFLALSFRTVVQGDGVGYFAYLHSVIVDHDLDMSNEYAAAHAAGVHIAGDVETKTSTGLPPDQFPIGPAVLSAPFFLLALVSRPSAQPIVGPPFTTAFTLASLLYGVLALALACRLVQRLGLSKGAAPAVVVVALATPFLYYLVYEPSYSHTFSAFMVSAFVYLWWTRRDRRTAAGWLVLGLVGGLMALVRWQDGPLMAITLLDLPRARWRLLLLAPGTLLVFAPQLAVDEVIFGRLTPGASTVSFDPLHGHYLEVLFSSWRGLFVWSPVLVLAVAGYAFVRERVLTAAFAAAFAIDLAIIGAFIFWYAGAAFGMRFFINLTPFFAVGLAALFARWRPIVSWLVVAAFTAWNLVLVLNFDYVISQAADPGYAGLLSGQARALAYLPHLAQGYVVRSLARGSLLGGLSVLAAEAAIVAVGIAAAIRVKPARSAGG